MTPQLDSFASPSSSFFNSAMGKLNPTEADIINSAAITVQMFILSPQEQEDSGARAASGEVRS